MSEQSHDTCLNSSNQEDEFEANAAAGSTLQETNDELEREATRSSSSIIPNNSTDTHSELPEPDIEEGTRSSLVVSQDNGERERSVQSCSSAELPEDRPVDANTLAVGYTTTPRTVSSITLDANLVEVSARSVAVAATSSPIAEQRHFELVLPEYKDQVRNVEDRRKHEYAEFNEETVSQMDDDNNDFVNEASSEVGQSTSNHYNSVSVPFVEAELISGSLEQDEQQRRSSHVQLVDAVQMLDHGPSGSDNRRRQRIILMGVALLVLVMTAVGGVVGGIIGVEAGNVEINVVGNSPSPTPSAMQANATEGTTSSTSSLP